MSARPLLLLPVLLVSACGGGGAPAPPAHEAEAAVQRYYAAFARSDAAGMCRELAPGALKEAAAMGHTGSCEAAAKAAANETEPELLRVIGRAQVGAAQVRGNVATVPVTAPGTYAVKARTARVPLQASGGQWHIRTFSTGQTAGADPVTGCVLAGLKKLDAGDVAPLWKREGRADFDAYIAAVCKRAYRLGLIHAADDGLSAAETRRLNRLAAAVIEEMARSRRITLS